MTTFYFAENVSVTPNNSLWKVSKSSGFITKLDQWSVFSTEENEKTEC